MQGSKVRLLVADDHETVRKGLCSILQHHPGWTVIAEARDGREAVAKAKEMRPDVIVIDISMPILNGLEATRQILKERRNARVLVLTVHESESLIREVLKAGARGYLLKTDAAADLVAAVEALSKNGTFFTPRVGQIVVDGYLRPTADVANTPSLSPRQREILQLLAEGKTSKEVAVLLNISIKTAETHRSNLMTRLNCHSVTELVRYAVRNEMIEP